MNAHWMSEALGLARRGLGRVWPNPSVGCIIVRDGQVVGKGATQPGGRPHAEVVALKDAGDAAKGAIVYVSLEPCAHYGKTPPCADALVEAGISECHVALQDPDPRVNGKGLTILREAGILVTLGMGEKEARALNAGFFLRVQSGRPMVTVSNALNEDSLRYHDAQLESAQDGQGIWALVQGTGVAPVRWWLGGELPVGAHAWRRFSCDIDQHGMNVHAMLGQLGTQGITRVILEKNDPLVERLNSAGLIDQKIDD